MSNKPNAVRDDSYDAGVIQREREFHNQQAQSIDLDALLVRESFEAPTAIENRFILDQLAPYKSDSRILDIGCGFGESSVFFALQGYIVHAADVADSCLNVGTKLARKFNVDVKYVAAAANALPYPDNYFDIIYGNGFLHHVHLSSAAKEIHRVLKPGGKGFFIEPLPYNPVIHVYRALARGVRTDDERPLTFRQLKEFSQPFSEYQHQEFWFFSLFIFFHFFFIRRWHPSKVRYWKKVIEAGEEYRELFGKLQKMDRWVLKTFPFLKPLCWNSVIVVRK